MEIKTHAFADAVIKSAFPDISFPCKVNGKKLIAKYLGEEENPIDNEFKFSFSDGHQTSFKRGEYYDWLDTTTGRGSLYLEGVYGDLPNMFGFSAGCTGSCFTVDKDGSFFNVFVFDMTNSDGDEIKTVYYKGDYRFELKLFNGIWKARTSRSIEVADMIDDEMATLVTQFIKATEK